MKEEYVSLEDLNNQRKTGVTFYKKPSISDRLSSIKDKAKQFKANQMVKAPERIQARKEFFKKTGTFFNNTGRVVNNLTSRNSKVSKGFGKEVRGRLNQRANSGVGNIFTASSNSPNNIYNTPSNLGSNNPYNFTSTKRTGTTKAKRDKQITIRF